MRHFVPLGPLALEQLFLHAPQEVHPASADVATLACALGATLYSPGTRPRLAADLARMTAAGATSIVVCLEDSVRDAEVEQAQVNTIACLRAFAARTPRRERPLLFVRTRVAGQIPQIVAGLGPHADVLAGFVAPKVTATGLPEWLRAVRTARADQPTLRIMPVLESPAIARPETRLAELLALRAVLSAHRDLVLAVRVGGTDLASAFGLRRPRELTVWELRPVADALSDIVGVFGVDGGAGFAVSGAVWEYFNPGPSPGHEPAGHWPARPDTFAREIALDLAHGMTGKTVIHPSHVTVVNASATVDHEEYADARDVLSAGDGGAAASAYGNKMNEARPHRAWADRVLRRARIYGVRRPGLGVEALAEAVRDAVAVAEAARQPAVGLRPERAAARSVPGVVDAAFAPLAAPPRT